MIRGMLGTGTLSLASHLVGAPWWVLVTVFLLSLLVTTVLGLSKNLVPQDSADRVTWWRETLQYLARRRPGRHRAN